MMEEKMDEIMKVGEVKHHVKDYSNIQGHAVPGTIFMIIGLLWLHSALLKFQVARREAQLKGRDVTKLKYRNSLFSKYYSGCCAQLPVEAAVCVLTGVLGTFVELGASFIEGKFMVVMSHHSIMYGMYSLVGVCGLLHHYKAAVPPNIEYGAYILANSVQGFLFLGHVTGRTDLNVQFHVLLVKIIAVTVLFTAIEVVFKKSVLAAVGRSLAAFFQGLWLWVIGLILYPPSFLMEKWDQGDQNLHIVSTIYVLLIFSLCVMGLIMNFIVLRRVKRMNLATIERIQAVLYGEMFSIHSQKGSEKPLISDSDCEI